MTDEYRRMFRSPMVDPLAWMPVGSGAAAMLGTSLVSSLGVAAGRMLAQPEVALMSKGLHEQRAMVARHMRRLEPQASDREIDRMVSEAYGSYARYWAESLRVSTLSRAQIVKGVRVQGIRTLDGVLGRGKGVILALPHLGGWEWGGAWLAATGRPVSVVVERLDDPGMREWFRRYRGSLGMEVIPVGRSATAACVAALKANRVLCLLADRAVGEASSVDVEFFGEVTALPAGPATLSIRTGVPVLPAAIYFGRRMGEHLGRVQPPILPERHGRLREDVQVMTARIAEQLEALIRRAPTQWHLFQPNWPSDRS